MPSVPPDRGPQWLEHPGQPTATRPGTDPSRQRRLVALAAGGAVLAALVGLIVALPRSGGTNSSTAKSAGHVLPPIAMAADPATGERTAPFDGFAVSVETEPGGALVLVGGVPRGEAPVIAGVDCDPGEEVEIRAERAGFRPALAKTVCRSDTLVKMMVRLRR